jgi:putative ABC transport system permease protein
VVKRLPVSALDRKLLRDLWDMRSQALAIALVMAAGVSMYVAYLSNFDSLRRTVDSYYEQQRLADVFVSLKRAPERTAERLRDIPGVEVADTRVVASVTLDVPGMDQPAAGLLVSVPAGQIRGCETRRIRRRRPADRRGGRRPGRRNPRRC